MKLAISTLKQITENEWAYPVHQLLELGIEAKSIFQFNDADLPKIILIVDGEIPEIDGFAISEISYNDATAIISEKCISTTDEITGQVFDANYWIALIPTEALRS